MEKEDNLGPVVVPQPLESVFPMSAEEIMIRKIWPDLPSWVLRSGSDLLGQDDGRYTAKEWLWLSEKQRQNIIQGRANVSYYWDEIDTGE